MKKITIQLRATISKNVLMGVDVTPVLLPNGEIDKVATLKVAEEAAEDFASDHNWDADEAVQYIENYEDEDELEELDDEKTVIFDIENESDDFRAEFDQNYALKNSKWE